MREHEPGHSIGQRGFADALRAPDQPRMGNAPTAVGIEQRRLGVAVPGKQRGFARMHGCDLRFDLTRAHAELTALPVLPANRRSRKAAHIFAATASGPALASISTHRCGSSAATCRYASRSS